MSERFPLRFRQPEVAASLEQGRQAVALYGSVDSLGYADLIGDHIHRRIAAQNRLLDWLLLTAVLNQGSTFWPLWIARRLRERS